MVSDDKKNIADPTRNEDVSELEEYLELDLEEESFSEEADQTEIEAAGEIDPAEAEMDAYTVEELEAHELGPEGQEETVPLEEAEGFEDDSDGSGWDEEEAFDEAEGDDEDFYDFEAPKKKLSLKKLAPALFLLGAVGVGGYILKGPDSAKNTIPQSSMATPADMAGGTDSLWGNTSDQLKTAEVAGDTIPELPQPVSNVNEVPRPPNEAAYFEIVDAKSPAMPDDAMPALHNDNSLPSSPEAPANSSADNSDADILLSGQDELALTENANPQETPDLGFDDKINNAPEVIAFDAKSNMTEDMAEDIAVENPDMPALNLASKEDDIQNMSSSQGVKEESAPVIQPSEVAAPAAPAPAPEVAPETRAESISVMASDSVAEKDAITTAEAGQDTLTERQEAAITIPEISEPSPMPTEEALTPMPAPAPEPAPALANVAAEPKPDFDDSLSIRPEEEGMAVDTGTASYTEKTSGALAEPTYPVSDNIAKNVQPDVYFDSGMEVPSGQIATTSNLPRKIDPTQEPASKFVLVKKTASADDFNAQVVAAGRALKLERYDAAVELYDQLYRVNPRDPRILMGRAVSHHKVGRIESALQSYEELLEIDPDNTDALVNMLGILRRQYPEVALRRMMLLQDKFPGNPAITAQLGIMEADLGNWQDALRYLGMAASLEPRNAQHMFNMAIIAERAGDAKKAIDYYQEALEVDSVYGRNRSIPREQVYDRLSILRQRT